MEAGASSPPAASPVSTLNTGTGCDQRYTNALLVEETLVPDAEIPQIITVIRGEHDRGVLQDPLLFQGFDQPADPAVDE